MDSWPDPSVHPSPIRSTLDESASELSATEDTCSTRQSYWSQLLSEPDRFGAQDAALAAAELCPNSLVRYYWEKEKDGPWTTQRIAGLPEDLMPASPSLGPGMSTGTSTSAWLEVPASINVPGSDVCSIPTEAVPSDSGYASQSRVAISVRSGDVGESARDGASVGSQPMSWCLSGSQESYPALLEPLIRQERPAPFSSQDENASTGETLLQCPPCSRSFRCRSELKYVRASSRLTSGG